MRRGGIALCAVLLLAGCARPVTTATPQAWLKPGVQVSLPPPGISPAFSEQQLLTGTVKGQQQSLMVLLSANSDNVTLAGLSSLGIRLFRLTYSSSGIHSEQAIALPKMPPASQVLADVMLSRWPVSAWQPVLPRGWTLVDAGLQRQLRDQNGTLVTEIHYLMRGDRRQPVSIQQFAFGYLITIQTLDP